MDPIPDPALIVLVGPSGSGKSTWAERNFRSEEIISSDRLRAIVGSDEHDLDASADAFSILEQMVQARVRRRLLTVVDTLGFDDERRRLFLASAKESGLPAVAVVFDVPSQLSRERNRARLRPVPAAVLTSQMRRFQQVRGRLVEEGWILRPADEQVSIKTVGGDPPAEPERPSSDRSSGLRLLLHVARFKGPGNLRSRLLEMAEAAEEAGFAGISVMDHLMQIPQVGREWGDLPEAYSTLGFLAGRTADLRLGTLVTNSGLRNPALLAKTVATIDVLSGGRAFCGLGAGWFEAEQRAYGYGFDPPARRLDRMEDVLRILPLMWGAGKATYHGKVHSVLGAVSYPRPSGSIPIIVGGRGPRTVTLAARYAAGLNLVGTRNLDNQIQLLRKVAAEAGRDPEAIEVSVLDTPLLGVDRSEVARSIRESRGRMAASAFAAGHNAGTTADHIERLRRLEAAGVGAVFVSPIGLKTAEGVTAWKPVIEALK